MTRRGVILLAFVIMSLVVGFMTGYRFRISQEEVTYYPPQWRQLNPPDNLTEYDGERWASFVESYGW